MCILLDFFRFVVFDSQRSHCLQRKAITESVMFGYLAEIPGVFSDDPGPVLVLDVKELVTDYPKLMEVVGL